MFDLFEYYVWLIWVWCLTYLSIMFDLFEYYVWLIWVLCLTYLSIMFDLFEYYVWLIWVLCLTYLSVMFDLFEHNDWLIPILSDLYEFVCLFQRYLMRELIWHSQSSIRPSKKVLLLFEHLERARDLYEYITKPFMSTHIVQYHS